MSQEQAASAWCGWSVPECPFLIAYSREMLDDIRLAVVDAFFSIPHGGAEVGGVLFGRHEPERVIIYEQALLECEHLTGPSFTLSAKDLAGLRAMLAAAQRNPRGLVPVGWWHSHTRTDIFLSDADLAVYNQFFPEPRQIALVLKPHSFEPTRAGFFFRDPDGQTYSESSLGEFIVEPLTRRQPSVAAGRSVAAQARRGEAERRGAMPGTAPEVNPSAVPIPAPPCTPAVTPPGTMPVSLTSPSELQSAAPEAAAVITPAVALAAATVPHVAEPITAEVPLPSFAQVTGARSYKWLVLVGAVLACAGIGGAGFYTRDYWLNASSSGRHSIVRNAEAAAAPALLLGLRTIDTDGQLWILWDRTSSAVRSATGGTLAIVDGSTTQSIDLDPAHLQTGSFTYGRQQERVDVILTLELPGGGTRREITTYLGKVPVRPPAADESLQKTNRKLLDDLNAERARARRLEDSLNLQQQRRRLQKQLPDQ